MTTWTPATEQSEAWTTSTVNRTLFSAIVFSNATYNSKYVFAFDLSGAESWRRKSVDVESWTAA